MIRKVSQSELKKLEAEGVSVKRKMGAAPKKEQPPKPKEEPKVVEMASMKASQQYFDAQAEALRMVIAHNSAMLEAFKDDLNKRAPEEKRPAQSYEFLLERSTDKLLKRVVVKPIKEGA